MVLSCALASLVSALGFAPHLRFDYGHGSSSSYPSLPLSGPVAIARDRRLWALCRHNNAVGKALVHAFAHIHYASIQLHQPLWIAVQFLVWAVRWVWSKGPKTKHLVYLLGGDLVPQEGNVR